MINWESLYWKICVDNPDGIHKHHIWPKHTKIKNNITVKLTFRNHVLAHYIRYRWLHEKNDRLSIQILTRKNVEKYSRMKSYIHI